MAPQRPDKNEKMAQIAAFCIIKKNFLVGMPPDPPNSLICSVFLALDAAGPLQCERLEPPVGTDYTPLILEFLNPYQQIQGNVVQSTIQIHL